MKKRNFQKGAISVFLTIILVPSIVMSSIFVDLSRVKLSQSVATSAADLSLNSLMSYYDTDLKDFYGMVVSCQNIEQFYAESEQYFLNALYSQGLDDDDIDSLLALYTSLVENGEVHDLLLMDVQTELGQIVSGVPDATLGDSSLIMKDQIVEFMKYRAPIEITTGIIDRLKKNNASAVLGDAEKNKGLVESKQKYAEDEADLLEAAFYTYKYIKEYEKTKATLTKIKDISQRMETYRGLYKEINAYMVSNLVNTKDLTIFKRPTYSLTYGSSAYNYKDSSVSRHETETTTYTKDDGTIGMNITHYYYAKYSTIYSDAKRAVENFENAKRSVVDAVGSDLLNATTGQTDSHANAIQWWVRADKAINKNSVLSNFKNAAEKMLKQYDRMCETDYCDEDEAPPSGWYSLKTTIENYQRTYLTAGVTNNSDSYLKFVSKLENISSGNIGKINANNLYLSNGKSIPATVTEINTKLNADIDTLNSYIDALSIVIDGKMFGQPKSLDKLKNLVTQYKNSFNAWKGNANSLNGVTELGTADWKEIQGISNEKDTGQNDGKDRLIEIKESDVTQLKTRLVNIRTQFKDLVSAIKELKYCGKKLIDIDSYNALYNAAKGKISDIPLKNGEISTKADSVFNSQFKPSPTAKLFTVNESSDYNPDLTVSKPTLYAWMEQKFKNDESIAKTEEELKTKKSEINGNKDKGNSEKAKDKEKEKEAERTSAISPTNIYGGSYSGSEFPSGLDKGSHFVLGSSFIGTLGSFIDILTGDTSITSIRDTIYSAEYVMDMFSYNTYENEGLYKLYKEKYGEAPTENEHLTSKELQTAWGNDAKTFTNNKTLTNMRIYEGNNVANGAEVEYVLYGDTNKSSVTSAYVNIFEIRYILNMLSGFQNFWGTRNTTGRAINGLASTIASATSGIIPAPLTKTVAILLLTAFETGKDLDRMSKGLPVELYKGEKDWVYSISDDWSTDPVDKKCENGLFYSDYLYLFLFLGFQTGSASEMYLRIGDLMQANMRKYTGSEMYSLKNSQVYFKLNATIRVRPLMLALPIAKNGFLNNPADKNDWCTFTISEIRGYS